MKQLQRFKTLLLYLATVLKRSKAIAKASTAFASTTSGGALRLAHFFGTSADFWLNLQKIHDLRLAKEKAGDAIEDLPTLASELVRA